MTPVIVDIIGDVVSRVQTNILPTLSSYDSNIVNVNYLYGPPKEIINRLTGWNRAIDQSKYPLVALFQSFPERFTAGAINTVDLHVIIAKRNSDTKLLTPQRYQNNFKPVLYPVYDEFMKQLGLHKAVVSNGYFDHTKNDWPFWGGSEDQPKNPFNDMLDIIELKINNLTIKLKNC